MNYAPNRFSNAKIHNAFMSIITIHSHPEMRSVAMITILLESVIHQATISHTSVYTLHKK